MRVLALIPARGGSKRLPGKNVRDFGGRPLLAWSVDVVRGLPEVVTVLVSTDDPQIATVAAAAGAAVPWLRPPQLATDAAGSVEVALHALDWYEGEHGAVDALLLLQPTSPLRSRATVQRGLELFAAGDVPAVVAVSPAPAHPWWCFRLDAGRLEPFIDRQASTVRSQDLPPAYAINGAFYLIAPAVLRAERNFVPAGTRALVVDDPAEAIDIDTELDWRLAEAARGMLQR